MRYIFMIVLLACGIGCASTSTPTTLNGTWVPIKQAIAGKELPLSYFQSQKLIIQDTSYSLSAESVDIGTLSYANGTMDIYGKEGINKGKHFTALYKLEANTLTIVYNLKGDSYPTDFETSSKATLFLSIFKRM